ncbi:hypothetical protein C8R44DRAFT_728174 [Mycena epipterygia]|nr:hypothetical protein C8R44DRAFT_728174 [Mycena epipterygia]
MTNVVSLIASVLQFIDTAAKARDYIQDFCNAPADQQRLFLEIQNLEPLIRELDNWLLWGKKDVQEGLDAIKHFKSLLNAWLGMDVWSVFSGFVLIPCSLLSGVPPKAGSHRTFEGALTDTISNQISHRLISTVAEAAEEQWIGHSYIAKSVKDIARNQERYLTFVECNEILEWFSLLNFFLRQADLFHTRQPGTGGWLLEDTLFKEWKSGQRRCWKDCALVYLNHKETETQSPSNLLAGLWWQFVFRKSISIAIHSLYETHYEPCIQPLLEEIHAVLCTTVAEYSKVFVIVNALNEYPEEQRYSLLRCLSRWNGFLLAKLHVDSLTTKHTVKAVQDALDNMPSDLESTNDEVISRINRQSEDDRNLARRTLSWITNVKRPLRPSKLREALAVEPNVTGIDPDNLLDINTIISICAGLLIVHQEEDEIRLIHYTTWTGYRTKNFLMPKHKLRPPALHIYLLMHSFNLEHICWYLIKEEGTSTALPQKVHTNDGILIFVEDSANTDYANEAECGSTVQASHHENPKIIGLLLTISSPPGDGAAQKVAASFGYNQPECAFLDGTTKVNGHYGTALCAAASENQKEGLRLLLENSATVNMQGKDYGTSLSTLKCRGYGVIAHILNEERMIYGSILRITAFMGYKGNARFLIEHGANVNSKMKG